MFVYHLSIPIVTCCTLKILFPAVEHCLVSDHQYRVSPYIISKCTKKKIWYPCGIYIYVCVCMCMCVLVCLYERESEWVFMNVSHCKQCVVCVYTSYYPKMVWNIVDLIEQIYFRLNLLDLLCNLGCFKIAKSVLQNGLAYKNSNGKAHFYPSHSLLRASLNSYRKENRH